MAVTVAGALAAWRASLTALVAALRDVAVGDARPSRLRLAAGGIAVAAGSLAVVIAGGGALGAAALGACCWWPGWSCSGRPPCGPCARCWGRRSQPAGSRATSAYATQCNPRRSAATAGALLVGMGVVNLFTVFGVSATRSVDEAVTRSFAADLALTPAPGGLGIAPDAVDRIAGLPEVAAAAGVGCARRCWPGGRTSWPSPTWPRWATSSISTWPRATWSEPSRAGWRCPPATPRSAAGVRATR